MKSKNALSTVLTLILILTIMSAVASAYDGCSIESDPETQSSGDPLSTRIDDILAEDKSAFLFFSADWCPYCHQQMPIINELEEEYAGDVAFIRINVTERPDHAAEFNVSGLPTMIMISCKNGGEYAREEISGFTKKAGLVEMIAPGEGGEPDATDDVGVGVGVTALAIKCNSCSDCTKKLNGDYGTVVLTTDLINVGGSCIIFGASNVVFSGGGHRIDGDDSGDLESGIAMTGKTGNTIKNCVITDFESGITLYGSSENVIYGNKISSNYYDGVWISEKSNSNNIHDNQIEDNGKYGVFFSSNSNDNTFSENVACSNPTDIHDEGKNSGDDNACETTHNWNDAGTQGCTHDCTVRKPDLVITDVSNDGDTICYTIKNIGDATAQKGHHTTLHVDSVYKIKEQVNVDMASGASVKRRFDHYSWSCTAPEDKLKVCADYGNFVDESNEKNNCREETWKCVVEKPDLVITDVWNVSNTIHYKIKNQGKATAGASYTSLSIDGVFKAKDYVASLASGATRTESFDYQWACTPPGDTIKVCADYQNGVAESNDKNNCREETWKCAPEKLPDLVITDVSNYGGTICYTIKNIGDATAQKGHHTTLHVDSVYKIKEQVNVDMASGASVKRRFDHYSWSCTAPEDKLKVCADYGNFVDESNEKNNCREETWKCVVEKPDLVITDVWNVSNTIHYKIKNQGKATAGASYTSLSIDGVFKAKDYVASLASGATRTESFDYQWACTPLTDTIKVCADYQNGVAESNEGNNCRKETWKCAPEKLPDLVITDVWNEDSTICYQIRNIGDATAPGGHHSFLSIDGNEVAGDPIGVELESGERLKRCFNYAWQCIPPDDAITVCADHKDDVGETDEGNNCRNESWKCDNTPPVIVSGPVVSDVTQSSVTVSWTTNEDSDSLVRFGRTAGKYADQKSGLKMKQEHKVILKDLLPSTTYRYLVESTDASENTVVSQDGLFETSPLPDDEPPVVHALNITRGKGDFLYYEMSADATDNIGVERVEFYIDGKLIGTDYSAPYQCQMAPVIIGMTREDFFGVHMAEAVVFDRSTRHSMSQRVFDPPDECEDISIDFEYPYPDRTLYTDGDVVPDGTTVPIKVYAAVQTLGIGQDWMGRNFPMDEISAVSRVEFYVNGVLIGTEYPPSNDEYFNHIYTCDWDASGFPPRTHAIMVKAIASEDCERRVRRDVEIEHGEPSLNVTREVTRTGNCFQVELTVRNRGTASVQLDKIEDNVDGFQPIRKRDNTYEVTAETSNSGRGYDIEIDLFTETGGDTITLSPGGLDGRCTVEYLAMPVLYPDSNPVEYAIGAEDVTVHHSDGSTENFDRPRVLTTGDELLSSSVDAAVELSDYLIVTNPARLFTQYNDNDVNELLSAMAELAQLKQGIPGYVQARRASNVRDQIVGWGGRMERNGYLSDGYLLLVGETEIIGSWEQKIKKRPRVHYTDLPYANTAGEWREPELIVGRIIGNDASELIIPIQTSINVYKREPGFEWDRSHALTVSGRGEGVGEFEENVDDVTAILDDEFSVTKLKKRSVENAGGDITAEFKAHDANRDVIFFRDHGGPTAWNGVIGTGDFGGADPVDFENSKPFAFACCCLAGRYEEVDVVHPGGENGIAETFLQHGTAVYIGPTEVSYRDWNDEASEKFFEEWVGSSYSVGRAFRNFKRDFNSRRGRRYWSYEYNLYGDPKYGSASTVAGAALMPKIVASEPQRSLEIAIPDYNVTTTEENEHHVEIPGGDTILELDKPMVPFYITNLDYPVGCRVQDVILTDRSGMTTETGLNIPDATMETDSTTVGALSSTREDEWWPEEVFEWNVRENPDGTSTLIIMMYPFYYNPLTTDVKFYKNYKFEINYTTSTVEIAALTTDKGVYQQGDDIPVNLWLNNSGDAQDVLIDSVVKAGGSGEVVNGLLLRTLKEFEGIASFSPQWNSDGFEPGYYFVEVTLKDTGGDVLDRKTEMFRLGISSGEIASFTATPECFDIGDEVEIELAFKNNGTVNITGTAVIRVLNSNGDAAYEFRHNVTNLTPSGSVSFSDTWDTSGTEEGSSYRVIGYVLYDSRSTDPATVTVRNMIMGDLNRDGVVTTADVAIALELAASGEYDPSADVSRDGQITSLDALMIVQAAAGNIELEGGES